ncbi:MAG: RNA polymerase sigma factor [Candidatus Hydrogenedentota bacterium]
MPNGAENIVELDARRQAVHVLEAGDAPLSSWGNEDLMIAYGAGRQEAFAELLRRHQKGILNFVFRMVQNRHIAEELTQEVFMALVKNRSRYTPTAKFTTYLYTIASNIVSKEWASQRRRPKLFNRPPFWNRDKDGDLPDPIERMSDATINIVRDSERGEISEAINLALMNLPEHQRQAFVLHRFQDLPYQEVADIMAVPVGTVKSRVVRAERGLRPYLERFREYL